MNASPRARRVILAVTIDGHDATSVLSPSLLEFSYTDNAGGKADEVRLTLHDRDGKWTGPWKPRKGMPVTATLKCLDWERQGEDFSLPCGAFTIDEVEVSGPPDKVTIKAVSADLTGPLRETARTRAWENTSLETVAGQIAEEYGLSLLYTGKAHAFARSDQRNESDLAYLNRMASGRGMNCKVHDGRLILMDAQEAENRDTAVTLSRRGDMYSPRSYSFRDSSADTAFSDAEVAYADPATGTTHCASVAAADTANGVQKTLTSRQRAENAAQAQDMGGAALHAANVRSRTASVECLGCPRLVAGTTVGLDGFGDFSGRWFVKTATHRISGSGGYTTSLELTTPAPTRAVSAHDEVSVAAEAARAGAQAARKERRRFERLYELVLREGTELDRLLVCLPEIAAAMAERTKNSADRQGWLYLHEMFLKWFSGPANSNAENCDEPLWIDWDWLMRQEEARSLYTKLKETILNENARRALARMLLRDGKFTKQREIFDYTAADPRQWAKAQHQFARGGGYSPELLVNMTGLFVALGEFSMYGFARGYVEPLPDGRHRIHVTGASAALHDTFNFDGNQYLGLWNCFDKKFEGILPDSDDALMLENGDFRSFREKYGYGGNFLVITEPHDIENFEEEYYDVASWIIEQAK